MTVVNRREVEPVYRQISRILEEEILSHYEAGESLPAETALADRFSVNRHTLRHAVDELVGKGLLARIHGKGTFVLQPALNYAIGKITRFTESLEARGISTRSQIVKKLTLPGRGGVARRLKIEAGGRVIMIETLREVEAVPHCLITHFLPAEGFEAVMAEYDGGSLHGFLRRRYALELKRSESLVTALLPTGDDARLLRMPLGMPVLRVKSANTEAGTGRPVEYAVTRWRADRVQLQINP